MRLTCPACRLPMVGTKAIRSPSWRHPWTRSRTAAIVVTVSKLRAGATSEAVLGTRVLAGLHRAHVALESVEVIARAFHEITYEARLPAGGDIQHVIGDKNLAVGVGARTDTDDRHVELRSDGLAERCRDAFEQHDIGAGGFQAPRLIEEPRSGLALAALVAKAAGLVHRLG